MASFNSSIETAPKNHSHRTRAARARHQGHRDSEHLCPDYMIALRIWVNTGNFVKGCTKEKRCRFVHGVEGLPVELQNQFKKVGFLCKSTLKDPPGTCGHFTKASCKFLHPDQDYTFWWKEGQAFDHCEHDPLSPLPPRLLLPLHPVKPKRVVAYHPDSQHLCPSYMRALKAGSTTPSSSCSYGKKCRFVHGIENLPPHLKRLFKKTGKTCDKILSSGTCKNQTSGTCYDWHSEDAKGA